MKDRTKLSERQRNILRFIEQHLENHGFPPTIRQIGKATNIESTSVVNYNLNKLVSAGYLSREARASRGLRLVKNSGGRRATPQTVNVPMYGQIAAGLPIPIPEDAGHEPNNYVEVLPAMLHNVNPAEAYALRVKGDSMIDAMINDGDIVVLQHQNSAHNGDMVAVWLEDRGEVTLKYFYNEGERIRLEPAHPTMKSIYVETKDCHIKGRVLSVLRLSV